MTITELTVLPHISRRPSFAQLLRPRTRHPLRLRSLCPTPQPVLQRLLSSLPSPPGPGVAPSRPLAGPCSPQAALTLHRPRLWLPAGLLRSSLAIQAPPDLCPRGSQNHLVKCKSDPASSKTCHTPREAVTKPPWSGPSPLSPSLSPLQPSGHPHPPWSRATARLPPSPPGTLRPRYGHGAPVLHEVRAPMPAPQRCLPRGALFAPLWLCPRPAFCFSRSLVTTSLYSTLICLMLACLDNI